MRTQSAHLTGELLEQRYRVGGLIARGGMSTVYRGVDVRLQRPVAIKVMDPRFADDQSFIDRFVREAQTVARLHDPGVVSVYDQGVDRSPDGDTVFLVMELVDGANLRDLLRERGVLPVAVAVGVLEQVLSALAAAHRAGLVHRDVKPENVLISQDGVVKVADFGLVRAVAGATTTSDSMILGTVAYLSPEQVAAGASDARSDVYSAGILCYEMLTGAPPYVGDNAISVAYRHVNDDVPAPSEAAPGPIPAALDELVLRATRREPAQRPADAGAFLAELRDISGALGIQAAQVPLPAAAAGRGDPTDDTVSAMAPIGPQGTRAMSRADLEANATTEDHRRPRPTDAYHERRARGRRRSALWISAIALCAAVIAAAGWWLGIGQWSQVPTVAGLDQSVAEQRLHDADLTAQIVGVPSNTVPAGRVLDAQPGENQPVIRGSTVTLRVSRGRPRVPDIKPGTDPADADRQIAEAGLQPRRDAAKDDFSATVPQGQVLRLQPGAGTPLDVGAPVVVVLSKGATVPDVTGMSHDDAFAALTKAGFDPYDAGADFSDKADKGKVARTDPPAGAGINPGHSKRVGVYVSTAITVPDLKGKTVAEARDMLAQLGLEVQAYGGFFGGSENSPVLSQSPPAGTRVRAGTVVTVTSNPFF